MGPPRHSGIFPRVVRDPRLVAKSRAETTTGHPCAVADFTGEPNKLHADGTVAPPWRTARLLALLASIASAQNLGGFCARYFGVDRLWAIPVRTPVRDFGCLLVLGPVRPQMLGRLESNAAELGLVLEAEERRSSPARPVKRAHTAHRPTELKSQRVA
jgi:hypothetical protein